MENPDGLRIEWEVKGHVMTGHFAAPEKYQSWKGIVHGGILATLLDEAMTRLVCIACDGRALTAEMTVRYVAPARIGDMLFIRGEIIKESKRLIETKATIHSSHSRGTLLARATGKIIKF